ncbi:MAG: flagellar basal body-associated FliL family protein [Syntrophaceae bacterium]
MGRAELDLLDLSTLEQFPVQESGGGGTPQRPRFGRVLMLVLGACLTVVIGAAGVCFWLYQPPAGKQDAGEANIPGSPYIAVDRFTINLKDDSGNNVILFCDLALEAVDPGRLSAEQKMDLRRAIYRKFKQRRAEQVRVPKFKQEFAGELKAELNGIYGENFITNVYFTRFIIL